MKHLAQSGRVPKHCYAQGCEHALCKSWSYCTTTATKMGTLSLTLPKTHSETQLSCRACTCPWNYFNPWCLSLQLCLHPWRGMALRFLTYSLVQVGIMPAFVQTLNNTATCSKLFELKTAYWNYCISWMQLWRFLQLSYFCSVYI